MSVYVSDAMCSESVAWKVCVGLAPDLPGLLEHARGADRRVHGLRARAILPGPAAVCHLQVPTMSSLGLVVGAADSMLQPLSITTPDSQLGDWQALGDLGVLCSAGLAHGAGCLRFASLYSASSRCRETPLDLPGYI